MYYYGMKPHNLGFCNPITMPYPEQIIFTLVSVNYFTLLKEAWTEKNRRFFEDKMYNSTSLFCKHERQVQIRNFVPCKGHQRKG